MIRYPIPPMIHGATQSATWMSLFSGQTTVLAPEFDADEVWQTIEKHKVNLLFFTGDAMARPLLDALTKLHDGGHEPDLSSLFLLASTAALFSTSIKEKFLELLPNRVITDSIGSSETGFGGTSIVAKGQSHTGGPRVTIDHRTVVLDEDGNEVKPGSGVRGMIAKKGNIPVGYYKDEKKTAETFKTFNGVRYAIPGDYAEVDEDGSVTMLGRGSQSINSGGEKIYPEEVEAALKGHPDVFDALVVGVPDERYGNCVAAVIHRRPGTNPSLTELDTFVRQEIADTKCRARSGGSTRSTGHRQASPTTDGPRTPPRNVPPTTPTPTMWEPQPDANRALRPLRHRLSDLRLHTIGEGRRGGQQGGRARCAGLRAVQRGRRPRERIALDGREHRRQALRRRHRDAGQGATRGLGRRHRQAHPAEPSRLRRENPCRPWCSTPTRRGGAQRRCARWLHSVARSHVEVALRHPIKLIANALGSPPKDVIDQAHEHGVPVAALAGSATHALRHVENGVDIVVAQGHEAGGHTGEIGSMVLWPEIVDAVGGRAPVLAAGGIGTGSQVAAALALGAQGVWMGSAFLTSAEYDLGHRKPSGVSTIQEALLRANSSDTVRRRIYTGKPARLLKSRWTDAWDAPEAPEPLPMPLQNILVSEAHQRMNESDNPDTVAMPVGQIVGRMNEIRPVADIIAELVEGFEKRPAGSTASGSG